MAFAAAYFGPGQANLFPDHPHQHHVMGIDQVVSTPLKKIHF